MRKGKEKQTDETKQPSEPNSDMMQILKYEVVNLK